MKSSKVFVVLLLLLMLFACKNFFKALRYQPVNVNAQHASVVEAISLGTYDSAIVIIERSKTHNLPKSELLKKLELARLLFLSGKYQESAKLFVEAEYKIEDKRTYRYVDAFAGSAEIYNPFHPNYIGPWTSDLANYGPRPFTSKDSLMLGNNTMQTDALYLEYNPNNLEKPLVNFYNGLNSAYLNQDLWIVEAKRLGLLADILDQQKAAMSLNFPYTPNPFVRLAEGLFYEAGGSLNDALISYENAYKDFENTNCNEHYGVSMPKQLKSDILCINKKMGFTDKESVWRKKLNEQASTEKYVPSIILILEEGTMRHKLAYPQLPKTDTVRTQTTENKGVAVTVKTTGVAVSIPGNGAQQTVQNYRVLYLFYQSKYVLSQIQPTKPVFSVVCNKTQCQVNKILNLNYLAEHAYGKRYYYELMGHGSASNSDYRQWLTLPASISYARIPMVPNQKSYTVKIVANGKVLEKEITIDNTEHSTIRHIYLPVF